MPFSVADYDIHDSGQADFGAVRQILYVATHVISPGQLIHEVDIPSGYLYKLGWVSLGDHFTSIGAVDRWYWREPIRLTFGDVLWTPQPTHDSAGNPFTVLASGVRWYLSPGTALWLYIFAWS